MKTTTEKKTYCGWFRRPLACPLRTAIVLGLALGCGCAVFALLAVRVSVSSSGGPKIVLSGAGAETGRVLYRPELNKVSGGVEQEAGQARVLTSEVEAGTSAMPAMIRILIHEHGVRSSGALSWVQGAQFARLIDCLSDAHSGGMADDVSAMHADAGSGEHRIPVNGALWTWVRLRTASGRVYFERVAPFSGAKEIVFEVSRSPFIHICAVEEDWSTPASLAHVGVRSRDVRATLTDPAEVACDDVGYATVTASGSAFWVLSADADNWSLPPPSVQSVMIEERRGDMCLKLVESEKLERATLRVEWRGELNIQPRPKVFLRSVSGPPRPAVPQTATLMPGLQDLEFELAPGRYMAEVLPLGCCRILGGQWLDLSSGGSAQGLVIEAAASRIGIKLCGLGLADFPVHVSLLPSGGLLEDVPEMFLGDYRWHASDARVAAPAGTWLFAVTGRHGTFLSEPITLGDEDVRVDLVPASVVELTRFDDIRGDRGFPLMTVSSSKGEHCRGMERRFVLGPGARRPAWVSRILVAHGSARVGVMVGDQTVWEQEIPVAGQRIQLVAD